MSSDVETMPLLGGHPALDLINTVAPREALPDGCQPQDRLTSPMALLAWARRAGLADAAESELAARAWERDPGAGAAALAGVRELRDSLYIALLEAAGLVAQQPDVAAVARQRLHDRWVAAVARSALRLDRGVPRPDRGAAGAPRTEFGPAPEFQVLDRLAATAMDLLLTVDYGRLRRCPPEEGGCGWIVLDQTRNGSRRWCQMADCGSAAKSRRLTERRRARRHHLESLSSQLPATVDLEEA
jgi:predicted RNA-binding Zn ribbon-like protein